MSGKKIWVLEFLDFGDVYISEDKNTLLKHACAIVLSYMSDQIKNFSNPRKDYEQDTYDDYLEISSLIRQGLYEDAIQLYMNYNLTEQVVIATPLEFEFLDDPKI
jgi:hypothetical protein